MNWVQINERIFELEKLPYLMPDEIEEYNTLVKSNVAGIVKRQLKNEEDYRKAKTEGKGTQSVEIHDVINIHGHMVREKTQL